MVVSAVVFLRVMVKWRVWGILAFCFSNGDRGLECCGVIDFLSMGNEVVSKCSVVATVSLSLSLFLFLIIIYRGHLPSLFVTTISVSHGQPLASRLFSFDLVSTKGRGIAKVVGVMVVRPGVPMTPRYFSLPLVCVFIHVFFFSSLPFSL